MRTLFFQIILGILVIGSSSQTFSQGNKMYLLLEDAVGKPRIADVAADGSFISPPLPKGSYTITLVIKKDVDQTFTADAGSSVQCTQFTINFDKAVTQPREITDSKGKRFLQIHRIVANMNPKDRYLPAVNRKLGIIAEEEDSDSLTGRIEITTNGNHETPADWMKK